MTDHHLDHPAAFPSWVALTSRAAASAAAGLLALLSACAAPPGEIARGGGADGSMAAAGGAAAHGTAIAEDAAGPVRVSSSAWLGTLPDGVQKRRFILVCTGCHVFDGSVAFPDDTARSSASWRERTAQMVGLFGEGTGFPVISAERDPVATAAWLSDALRNAPAPARAAALPEGATIREYAYPPPGDLPHDLVVDDDGRVTVTGMFTHRLWALDPATGTFTEEPIEAGGTASNPRAIDIAADGGLWLVLGAPMSLARRDPASEAWTAWSVGMYPHSVALDAQGRAWFNGHFTKDPPRWGYVRPGSEEVVTFDVPVTPALAAGNGPMPYGLRVAPDGTIWGTELIGNRLIRLDPASGAFTTWSMPTPHSGPRRPDVGADGIVWIPEYSHNRLARFDPATEEFTEFVLPVRDALPYVARVDRTRGTVWIGTGAADAVFAFDPATVRFTTYTLPTTGALVRHLDIDEETGEVWAAYGASPGIQASIARIAPPGATPREAASAVN
jgi:virginiamycin B lyase